MKPKTFPVIIFPLIIIILTCITGCGILSNLETKPLATSTLAISPEPGITATPTFKPTLTVSPMPSFTPTVTPIVPVTINYEGVTTYCTCVDCICLSNQLFSLTLNIDADGNVTGVFKKYLPEYSDMELVGTVSNIVGSIEDDNKEGNHMDFVGSLNSKFSVLNATISFKGPSGTGKREIYFSKKP